jgi:hypothetical protein
MREPEGEGDENFGTVILNFHPFFIALYQHYEAILDLGFGIAGLLYRFALPFLNEISPRQASEYHPFRISFIYIAASCGN